MTDQEINIKVAELCGWKPQTICTDKQGNPWPSDPPNYVADLNACHEFAAWLDTEQQIQFAEELQFIVLENPYRAWWNPTAMEVFQIADATARQRCEAFLRVHNQWEETE